MQEKINSFNAAFVDLAAGYVNRVAIRAAQKEPEPKGAAQQFRHELANEIQLANLLAATIGKMQAASGGEFPQDEQEDGKPHTAAGNMEFLRDFLEGKTRWNFPEGTVFNVNTSTGDGAAVQLKPEADGEPEPPERPEPVVKLGPGASFRLENTPIHGQYPAPDGVKVDAVERLQNLCSFCKEMECYRSGDSMDAGRQYGLIKGRAWGIDVVMLEFAISVLSELREIKEVRIPAEPNTPGVWELMRDILAGKRPAPEGTVFDVVIDMAGNPQAIRSREEPEPAPRALTISMPGGTETVKLTSIAEAYGMADCIKKMAACVWPEAANEPAPGGA